MTKDSDWVLAENFRNAIVVMKIRVLCVLSCLAVSLAPLAALAQTDSGPKITNGSITVPGKDIVFNDDYDTGPLDQYGGFQIGVKLPQKGITASGCGPYDVLSIQMADIVTQYQNSPIHFSPALIKRKKAYYAELLKLSKENKMVTINIEANSEYIQRKRNGLYAPYCIVPFAGFDK